MLTDITIEDAVRDRIQGDPRIEDANAIAISVENGTATLRGTVGTFSQRRAAAKDARGVTGVYELDDEISVRPLNDQRRDDADIRGVALQSLMWDVQVPSESVDVKVKDGAVKLTGEVTYQFESDAAYEDVAHLQGVVGVDNEIRVVSG
jgi:osmotically-inducible protein OsmY